MGTKVAAYVRVSTDGQVGDDKFGLEAQTNTIKAYCEEKGYEIIKWFRDEGESGAKERPGFDSIIYDNHEEPFEKVVVAKSDRVARDINIYFYYKMMLRKMDVELVSISEDFGQFGMFSTMLEAFTLCVAEMERENITKRTSAGRAVKSARGGYSGGRPPYGYKVVDKRLVIVPEKADVVRLIFDMKAHRAAIDDILLALEQHGYKTTTGRTRWSNNALFSILRNEKLYKGWYKYAGSDWVKGEHTPILDPDAPLVYDED